MMTKMITLEILYPGDLIPIGLLGGGEHFEDVARGHWEATRTVQTHINASNTDCPRTVMLDHVIS